MPDLDALAVGHYRRQQRLVRRAVGAVQRLWRRIDPADITGSWTAVAPVLVGTVAAGQFEAASMADPYVAAVLEAEGAESRPSGVVSAAAFAGQASDGRPLSSLLYQPVIDWKLRIAAGQSVRDAQRGALAGALRITATQVADAGRTAVGASMAGNRTIRGYIRVAAAPCCARCAILSGKEFGWNAGFARHPRCDCIHVPATLVARGRGGRLRVPAAPGLVTDARAYFSGLSRAEQDRIFTRAGAQAIRDGADISSVVNARRGMYTADAYGRRVSATREGTTRRGEFFRLERARAVAAGQTTRAAFRLRAPRLMPEEIYRLADDREDAIRMLRRFGYLT
ncbi:hypothetical protein [Streptomyces sp. CC228A]|uniref:VG15 protein n=1 Tax=Streptomyces sp. CC228A TaxID=2898186 RepID=UPI001F3A25C6|nr:hypothetical protein [Streptomyces sp. CC228A]